MYDHKKIEHKILEHWKANKTFEKSLENRKKSKRFVFYEGPPTANGLPGIHHVLARAYKDIICRYKTMRGFYVLRKAGWDTHGLPVELEVEKELGFKNKKDIEEFGVAEFNKKAKASVWKYKKEWEEMTQKIGFWVDMGDPYITYESKYIESLWAIIKKIWDKKLLYKAHRVVPFCTRCGTPLSSHEVAQDYRSVKDNSVYVKFKIKGRENTYILAWTTTPWTLPGNVALAVGKDIKYVGIKIEGGTYVLAESAIERVFGTDNKYEILDTKYRGADLVGLEYEPLFNIPKLKSSKSYKIYDADFVSTEDGTGVVHTAVMYGEDDYELGTKVGLPKFHTVDEAGKFVDVNEELNGKYVKSKETENIILEHLRNNNNLLEEKEYEHDYPFCWRCGTPLLYYAKDSWFIKMSAVNKKLLANNKKINWIPEHIKEGRFGQWLKEGKDWAFSRERYWGTPLPIWECKSCDHKTVVGSIEELEKNSIASNNTYYLMRHGGTNRNEGIDNIVSTHLEHDSYHLTDEGKEQVRHSLKQAKLNDVDYIFSSPFLRTKETAEIAGHVLHKKIELDDRLREAGHSLAVEGKKMLEIHVDAEGPEKNESIRKRLSDFMSDLETKYHDKKILIVSHGAPIWFLQAMGEGFSEEDLKNPVKFSSVMPALAELRKLKWRSLPRNEHGEFDPHRPFIDKVVIKCRKCSGKMHKIPDLIDVWFDSGSMPFAQWHWPFKDQKSNIKNQKEQFPADYIVEGMDQTRGWFYTLLAVSTLLGKSIPYKNVISLGLLLDEKGQKMSKSKGNVVSPFEVVDKFGADAARWYSYTINSPGDYKLFSMRDVDGKLKGFLFTLANCLRFYELYKPDSVQDSKLNILDQWVLSRLNRLIADTTDSIEKYDITSAARNIEKFITDDFSNWWLRRSRKRKEAIGLLRFLLYETSKLIAPFVPFIAEEIYLQTDHLDGEVNSVHLQNWPKPNSKLISDELEKQMETVRSIVTAGLALRKEKQVKVRQPLASVSLKDRFDKDLENLIKEELNVKDIKFAEGQSDLIIYDFELSQALIDEGYARELIRQVQDMRKEAGYKFDQEVHCQWHSDDQDIKRAVGHWTEEIKRETLLHHFAEGPHDDKAYDIEKEFELVANKKIWMGIKK